MAYERAFGDGGLGGISGVVSSLPAGYDMGEVRWQDGIKYRLLYNAGNSQINPGMACKHIEGGAGPYSCTVTMTSETVTGIRGVVFHATATTGTYFWGVTYGHPVKVMASNISLATGAQVGVAENGKFITTNSVTNTIARNIGDAAAATATTDAAGSRFLVFIEESKTLG